MAMRGLVGSRRGQICPLQRAQPRLCDGAYRLCRTSTAGMLLWWWRWILSRQIRVDHANWLDDGRIYRNDPVIDVSPENDWSAVRVWDTRDNVLGARTYLVRGFIGPDRERTTARRQQRIAARLLPPLQGRRPTPCVSCARAYGPRP